MPRPRAGARSRRASVDGVRHDGLAEPTGSRAAATTPAVAGCGVDACSSARTSRPGIEAILFMERATTETKYTASDSSVTHTNSFVHILISTAICASDQSRGRGGEVGCGEAREPVLVVGIDDGIAVRDDIEMPHARLRQLAAAAARTLNVTTRMTQVKEAVPTNQLPASKPSANGVVPSASMGTKKHTAPCQNAVRIQRANTWRVGQVGG